MYVGGREERLCKLHQHEGIQGIRNISRIQSVGAQKSRRG